MRKTATMLMAAGFLFVYFTLPFAGVDLLIDAVGYIFIFNAAWAFRLKHQSFKLAALTALVLVPVSALQLFINGRSEDILALVRNLLNLALLALLMYGISVELSNSGHGVAAGVCRGIFGANMIAATFFAFLVGRFSETAADWCVFAVRLILLGFLAWLAYLPTPEGAEFKEAEIKEEQKK